MSMERKKGCVRNKSKEQESAKCEKRQGRNILRKMRVKSMCNDPSNCLNGLHASGIIHRQSLKGGYKVGGK